MRISDFSFDTFLFHFEKNLNLYTVDRIRDAVLCGYVSLFLAELNIRHDNSLFCIRRALRIRNPYPRRAVVIATVSRSGITLKTVHRYEITLSLSEKRRRGIGGGVIHGALRRQLSSCRKRHRATSFPSAAGRRAVSMLPLLLKIHNYRILLRL